VADQTRTIALDVSGWTYIVAFPYRRHDQEKIICSGSARVAVDDADEFAVNDLYLEINRKSREADRSVYIIKDQHLVVTIYAERDDFFRIFQELKDHYSIPECRMMIEFQGAIDRDVSHELLDFELNLSVDR
jgi:hypothetical protein